MSGVQVPLLKKTMMDTAPTLAQLLYTARTQRGYSRQQLATSTKVPLSFIAAVETENRAALPSAVFCHGFLRIIAKHLRLDPAPLLSAYADMHPPPTPLPLATSTVLSGRHQIRPRPRRRTLLLSTIILALCGAAVFYLWQEHTTPPVPKLANARTPMPQVAVSTPSPSLPVPRQHLRLQVMRPLRVELSIDGGATEASLLLPQSYEYKFTRQAQLTIADTQAVKLWFNGEALGNLTRGTRQRRLVFSAASSATARARAHAGHNFQR